MPDFYVTTGKSQPVGAASVRITSTFQLMKQKSTAIEASCLRIES